MIRLEVDAARRVGTGALQRDDIIHVMRASEERSSIDHAPCGDAKALDFRIKVGESSPSQAHHTRVGPACDHQSVGRLCRLRTAACARGGHAQPEKGIARYQRVVRWE